MYRDPNQAIFDYRQFFARMKQMNFKPKVANLAQVKLDFADEDDDRDLKEAVDELKNKTEPTQTQNLIGRKRPATTDISSIDLKRKRHEVR